ncbi:amino acid permease [Nostoc sp. 3335mG]|nr:amino acid permease [Nostoc sp. 3335mG]
MWRVKSIDRIIATAEKKALHRSLGAFQLTMLGIGCIIGTGIFVLTAEAAQKAGPGMMVSFVIAAFVCAVAALCYAELTAMVPIAGSAYTYSYAVMGELIAWLVGWALVLEYAVSASAVAVGWSGYIVGLLHNAVHLDIPAALVNGPYAGGLVNLPAILISVLITWLLVIGTQESATVNAVLVAVKIAALLAFCALAMPVLHMRNFHPFAPLGTTGVIGAASSIFFAYVGFDAVSTAAEETRNPQRNLPISLIGSLLICTILYLLVAAGAIGAIGAQPLFGAGGHGLEAGSADLARACAVTSAHGFTPLVCSNEALAYVLRVIGHPAVANLMGLVAGIALPSVILTNMYGQTRIFFVMSRDGLLPAVLSKVHRRYKTPHVVTIITGVFVTIAAAFFPVGQLADMANSGTLFAFLIVSCAVMMLRRSDPDRPRPFRIPGVFVIAPLSAIGCVVLFLYLPAPSKILFPVWSGIGLLLYFSYGFHRSEFGKRHRPEPDA